MSFEIRALTAEEESARLNALDLAVRLAGGIIPLKAPRVQALYDVIREDFPNNTDAVIALGIAFGELIKAKAGYEWIRVEDEFGSETSLAPVGYDGVCHPLSMIQKRINRAELLDIVELCDDTIRTVQGMIDDGRCAPRNGGSSV
jgi:hypothetical protein